MTLDSATRAAMVWRVMAAALNAMGDELPGWNDLKSDVKGFVVKAVEEVDAGHTNGDAMALGFQLAGWKMDRWNEETKGCVLADVTSSMRPGKMAWAAALATLETIKEI